MENRETVVTNAEVMFFITIIWSIVPIPTSSYPNVSLGSKTVENT